jgi:hypothetical protein
MTDKTRDRAIEAASELLTMITLGFAFGAGFMIAVSIFN